MHKEKYNIAERVLDIWFRLETEAELIPVELAQDYGVTTDTIVRDIKFIRNVLDQNNQLYSVSYKKRGKYYQLERTGKLLSFSEVAAIMISLYCNRSFNKTEMESLEEKFIKLFQPKEERNLRKLFSSLKCNYKPVHHGETKEKINLLSHAIINQNKLSFLYKQKKRIVKPYSILYHDRMYYLIASEDHEEMKRIWRFDRIMNLKMLEEHFTMGKNEYFSSGDFANLTFNMFYGKPITVTLRVENSTVEYVQRAFPEANILSNYNTPTHTRMEVNVAGEEGILKWLLSQQDDIEVLSPLSLREKVQETIKNMARLYHIKIED